jgi:hypothetical protein
MNHPAAKLPSQERGVVPGADHFITAKLPMAVGIKNADVCTAAPTQATQINSQDIGRTAGNPGDSFRQLQDALVHQFKGKRKQGVQA